MGNHLDHNAMLTSPEYHAILTRHLLPMLAGATIDASPIVAQANDPPVIQETATQLLFRPDREWPFSFRISRTHAFDPEDTRLAEQFSRVLGPKLVVAAQPFFDYLIDHCAQEVVARLVSHRIFDDNLIPLIISTLQKWAAQTYEGNRIAANIAIDSSPQPRSISQLHVTRLLGRDCTKVLSRASDDGAADQHDDQQREKSGSAVRGVAGGVVEPQRRRASCLWTHCRASRIAAGRLVRWRLRLCLFPTRMHTRRK